MSLPILQTTSAPSVATLLRLFQKTQLDWTRHLGEEHVIDVGAAIHNAELPNVWDANRVLDAAVPPEMSASDAFSVIQEHYSSYRSRNRAVMLNVSAPAEQTQPLGEMLLARGYRAHTTDVMYLNRAPTSQIIEVAGLRIIPARASFKHARQLAEESTAKFNEPQLVEAAMLHLDDPHWDSVLALRDGQAVATGGVLTVGEIGLIEDVFVSEKFRGIGIGRTIMSRVLEICARGLLKHIFLEVFPTNTTAIGLYEKIGFKKIGPTTIYLI